MCVIAICNDRKLTDDELHSCWQSNDDGAGMAWFDGKKHVIEKGYMKYDEFKNRYEDINIFPHVVHFRIATAGGKIPELTHPFICSRKSPTSIEWIGKEPVLFHNGIVHNWYAMADMLGIKVPDHYWSDTRVLASIITEEELDFLKEEGGKYAVLVGKEIVTYGDFIEANGIQFSNSSYTGVWNVYAGFDYYDGWIGGSRYYTPRQGYTTIPQRGLSNNVTNEFNPCDGCTAFLTVENCRKYCVQADNPGSLPYKATAKNRALTVVPAKVDDEDPCASCRVVSAAVCNKYCPERLKPNFQFKPVGFRGKQANLACLGCNSGGNLCDSCSEKDKPGSMAPKQDVTPKECPDCHKKIYYGDWCFYCGIPIEKSVIYDDKPLNSDGSPFSDCNGRCEDCPEYDPINNNCKEVIRAMSGREENLKQLEVSLKKDDECVDRGESCYTCPNFDPDGYRCMVW